MEIRFTMTREDWLEELRYYYLLHSNRFIFPVLGAMFLVFPLLTFGLDLWQYGAEMVFGHLGSYLKHNWTAFITFPFAAYFFLYRTIYSRRVLKLLERNRDMYSEVTIAIGAAGEFVVSDGKRSRSYVMDSLVGIHQHEHTLFVFSGPSEFELIRSEKSNVLADLLLDCGIRNVKRKSFMNKLIFAD